MQIYEQTPKANSEKSYCRGGSGIIIIIVIYSLHDDNFSLFFWIFFYTKTTKQFSRKQMCIIHLIV